ncbi:leukocyte immunoglobulin-like receptor subfamily B member 2 [Larimichthys crocea]|uniref:leukocyte immunoglobulin-like receptor subfamily B member 2 n=1 Tax=Larimichthys crocea TaxID=215358 RepID=UPI0009018F7E|nr:leukocyte immunoglobulin-like receptor subfamily B member 2 [Larimichthys crocea]
MRLPKPSISMNPVGEVTWGQDIIITCSISTQVLGGTFILQKTSGSFRKTQALSNNSAIFSIPQVDFNNEGLYQCHYEKSHSSQYYSAPLSDPVRFSLTVSFPKPSISLNSVGEVIRVQDTKILCSISTQVVGGTFVLQNTLGSFRKIKKSSTSSATLHIPQVTFDNEGSYQCQYEKSSSSQSYNTVQSDSVRLSVSLLLLLSSVAAGILLLLVLVLLPVFLVCRRRRRAKQPEAVVLIQLSVIAGDDY